MRYRETKFCEPSAPRKLPDSDMVTFRSRSPFRSKSCHSQRLRRIYSSMPTHSRFDDMLWDQYRAQPPHLVPPSLHAPRNYVEMAARIDFEADADDIWQSSRASAWSSFLHAFFAYKSPTFFVERPPDTLSIEEQALWAGVAEALCTKLDLTVPAWTKEPRYFLPKPWDFVVYQSVLSSTIQERLAKSDPAFRKRNVVARARDFLVA